MVAEAQRLRRWVGCVMRSEFLFSSRCVCSVDSHLTILYPAPFPDSKDRRGSPMKVKSSIKALKNRHRDCKVVRRKGRTYVINKTDPRFKAKQG